MYDSCPTPTLGQDMDSRGHQLQLHSRDDNSGDGGDDDDESNDDDRDTNIVINLLQCYCNALMVVGHQEGCLTGKILLELSQRLFFETQPYM